MAHGSRGRETGDGARGDPTPPPQAPAGSRPAANRSPASASASSDTSARAKPSFASRRDARLVTRDHVETTRAVTDTSANVPTIESVSGPQWCARANADESSAADARPSNGEARPRVPRCGSSVWSSTAELYFRAVRV